MDTQICSIRTAETAARDTYDMTLDAPALAKEARPGQFVHVRLPGRTLRRPISICSADPDAGTLRMVFAVRGEGTRELAAMGPGEHLDLLGPLGNGFFIPKLAESESGAPDPEAVGAARGGECPVPKLAESESGAPAPEAVGAARGGECPIPKLAESESGASDPEAVGAAWGEDCPVPEPAQSEAGAHGAAGGRVLLVGGGIGVPPMLYLAQALGGDCIAALGFRSADTAILTEEFRALGCDTRVATEDGSMGAKGFVPQCFPEEGVSRVYACGPAPMLKAAAEYARAHGVPCEVSLEERMACGVGACLGCACRLLREDGTEYYGHVCKDGPVFDAQRVVW